MIQVIHRALDILELIAQDRSRLYTLSEISSQLKLNNATCANIIKTLVVRGYLEQAGRKTGYRLGSMSYLLTGNYSHKQELLAAATESINQLSDLLNESCILSVLKEDTRLVLYEVKSTHELQVINKKEKEAYRTSTGRMILACMEEKEQKEFIRKFGLPSSDAWSGIEDEEDLMTELNKIRKKQLAVQTSKAQVVGVAIPVYKDQKIIASLGVYLPLSRYTPSMQEKILNELRKTGDLINKRLNEKL
ncbi:MAG: IclR family transcriptional regulator [Mangrovibacterium sp.]